MARMLTFTVMADTNHIAMVAADHGHDVNIHETNDANVSVVNVVEGHAAQMVRDFTHYGIAVHANKPKAIVSDPTFAAAAARVDRKVAR